MFSPKQSENEGSSSEISEISKEEIKPVFETEPPPNNASRTNLRLPTTRKRQNKSPSWGLILWAIVAITGAGAFIYLIYLIYQLANHLGDHRAASIILRPLINKENNLEALTTNIQLSQALTEEPTDISNNYCKPCPYNTELETLNNQTSDTMVAKLESDLRKKGEQLLDHLIIAVIVHSLFFSVSIIKNIKNCCTRSTFNKKANEEASLQDEEPPMRLKDLRAQEEGLIRQSSSARNL